MDFLKQNFLLFVLWKRQFFVKSEERIVNRKEYKKKRQLSYENCRFFLEAPHGFEPGIKALQASALPLGYSAIYINLITDKTKDAF